MGARGPKPKPTQLRLLHGDRKDRINLDEPKPESGAPDCPVTAVDPDVRAVWDYTVRQLKVMGIVTLADRDALACYCEAVVTHRKASAILAQSSVLVRGHHNGTLVRNPALQIQRDAAAMISRYAQHFGLSPSSRSEIRTGAAKNNATGADRYLTG